MKTVLISGAQLVSNGLHLMAETREEEDILNKFLRSQANKIGIVNSETTDTSIDEESKCHVQKSN